VQHHAYLQNAQARCVLLAKGVALGKINVFLKQQAMDRLIVVPKSRQGKEMCLAYHMKGGCYEDCARLAGHGLLSNDEAESLKTFIQNGLEKLEASTPSRQ
jgi:hypothetical protein